ncbi:MAG: 16S rRNA (cytosine(1402)-N(4))-methyltransferase RsmH [Treponemataceae bacterium]
MEIVHSSVLLQECLQYLSPENEDFADKPLMVDSTLGEGGHSQSFLHNFKNLRIIGLDADKKIQARAQERLASFGDRMTFVSAWFDEFYAAYPDQFERPHIILFDLGISVFHYEKSGRGFSFRQDEALDMRLNPLTEESAEGLVNSLNEEDLANLIYINGEERYSRRIARSIVEERKQFRITTTKRLSDIIYHAVPSEYRRKKINPATKTFQALRIAVNKEFDRLESALENAFKVLQVGGKMGVITFHSLEDRIVKNFFRNKAKDCICPPQQPICICRGTKEALLLTRKAVCPTSEEIEENHPSRSAKLRVVRKIYEVGTNP